ncbi:MAG TPA: hypothetical protein VE965_09910, partial [Gammaproteobacteria bacterium]|nr:hypothetical protein [Gammaproteobacteria bacterium]
MFGELNCVANQVGEDLAQATGVAPQGHRHIIMDVAEEFQPFGLGALGKQFMDILNDLAQIEIDAFELQLAGLDLGEIQDVVDDGKQRFSGNAHGFGKSALYV